MPTVALLHLLPDNHALQIWWNAQGVNWTVNEKQKTQNNIIYNIHVALHSMYNFQSTSDYTKSSTNIWIAQSSTQWRTCVTCIYYGLPYKVQDSTTTSGYNDKTSHSQLFALGTAIKYAQSWDTEACKQYILKLQLHNCTVQKQWNSVWN